ncbi:MAG: hypothetical protein NT051_04465, partial [Candidatus Micrarchaeota archaeon]|nr:hypothetical protein [Candidatus Micrarchaeota archaeon]
CGKYGIDGYLAALSHSISPFKIRKGLAKLEKEGMLRKGEGFTEKGKEELLGMKAEILEYAARKEKVVS